MKSLTANPVHGNRSHMISFTILAIVLLAVFPLVFDIFRLNLVAKYLSLAFAAVGLVICWGHGGILSLGQGVFWGLGGYCFAAFLKLEAAVNIAKEAGTDQIKALTTVGLPDFMDWNQITELPYIWYPFKSFPLTLICVFAVPTILAYIIGVAIFKRRVSGVYFAIITQALCWIMEILFVTRQGWTGGINGITDLRTCLGWDIRTQSAQYTLYFLTVVLLLAAVFISQKILKSKLGQLMVAIRDMEDRVRFSGYDVSNFKIFAFCAAAVISSLGGALFVLNVGFMSPNWLPSGRHFHGHLLRIGRPAVADRGHLRNAYRLFRQNLFFGTVSGVVDVYHGGHLRHYHRRLPQGIGRTRGRLRRTYLDLFEKELQLKQTKSWGKRGAQACA